MRWRWWPHEHHYEAYFDLRLEVSDEQVTLARLLAAIPPSHTLVTLFVCECGVGEVFPEGNWGLAAEAERARILEMFGITTLLRNPVIR